MASEPIAFRIDNTVDWDGVTPVGLQRGDFRVFDQRYYVGSLEAPAGTLTADFFGVFSAQTPKLVGVASSSSNPLSVLRVLSADNPDVFRQEVELSPRMVHVPVFAGDRLAIVTHESGSNSLELVVTELSDRDHVQLASMVSKEASGRRVRIIRTGGSGFSHEPTTEAWQPALSWDPSSGVLIGHEVVNGVIPARDLYMSPRAEGCLLSVRYSGIGDGVGRLLVVDGHLREATEVEGALESGEWSRVVFVGRDDLIGLSSPGPVGNGKAVVCDLELVRIDPGERLRERHARGL